METLSFVNQFTFWILDVTFKISLTMLFPILLEGSIMKNSDQQRIHFSRDDKTVLCYFHSLNNVYFGGVHVCGVIMCGIKYANPNWDTNPSKAGCWKGFSSSRLPHHQGKQSNE